MNRACVIFAVSLFFPAGGAIRRVFLDEHEQIAPALAHGQFD